MIIHSPCLVRFLTAAFWRKAIILVEVPQMMAVTALFVFRCHQLELKTILAPVEHQALQLTMLMHRGANRLFVRRNEEMPALRVIKRLIQPHALAGICSGNDPGCNCPHLHARIPFSLLLDAKSPKRAASDTFDFNIGFGMSKGDA